MDATLDWMRRLSSTLIRPAQPAVPLPEKRGWLSLNGKRFYFVLRAGRLSFFPSENATSGGKRFNLAECDVKKVVSAYGLLIEITREKKSGKYVLAADSPAELDLWFAAMGVSAKSTRDEAEVLSGAGSEVVTSAQVFGVPLRQVLATARHSEHGMLPNIVRDCLAHLDTPMAFATPCLFSQEVEIAKLAPWVAAYNNGVRPFSPNAPASLIACLLKHYIKCLPSPVISEELYRDLQNGRTNPIAIRRVVAQMGQDSRFLLRSLCDLFNNVAFESKQEGNTAVEIATVFAPLLMWRVKKQSEPDEEMFVLRSIMAMGTMILHYSDVFEEQAPEVLREKEESSVDAFEELVAELQAATPRKEKDGRDVIKKPLPSLADWAKELRAAPSRPQLPATFREAAADAAREEGLGALDELEAELEAEKVHRKSMALSPSTSVDWAEVRGNTKGSHIIAASPNPDRFVVALDPQPSQADPVEKTQAVERKRAERASRRSNLSASQLASLRGRLETHMGGRGSHVERRENGAKRSVSPSTVAGPSVRHLTLQLERHEQPPPPPSAASTSTTAPPAPAATSSASLLSNSNGTSSSAGSAIGSRVGVAPLQLRGSTSAENPAATAAKAEVAAIVAKLKFDVLAWAEASALQLQTLHMQQQAELRRLVAEASRPLDDALNALVASAVPPPPPTGVVPAAAALSDGEEKEREKGGSRTEAKKEKKEKRKRSSKTGSNVARNTSPPPPPSQNGSAIYASPAPAPVAVAVAPPPLQTETSEVVVLTLSHKPIPAVPASSSSTSASTSVCSSASTTTAPAPPTLAASGAASGSGGTLRGEPPLLSKPLPARPPPRSSTSGSTSTTTSTTTSSSTSATTTTSSAATTALRASEGGSSPPPAPLPRPRYVPLLAEFSPSIPKSPPLTLSGKRIEPLATTLELPPPSVPPPPPPPADAAKSEGSSPLSSLSTGFIDGKSLPTEMVVVSTSSTEPLPISTSSSSSSSSATTTTTTTTTAAAVPPIAKMPEKSVAFPLPSPNLARLDAALAQMSAQNISRFSHQLVLQVAPPSTVSPGATIDPPPVVLLQGSDDPSFCVEVTAVNAATGAEMPLLLGGVTLLGVLPDMPLPFRKLRIASATAIAELPRAIRLKFVLLRHLGSAYAATGAAPLLSEPLQLVPQQGAPSPTSPRPLTPVSPRQPMERLTMQQQVATLVRSVRQLGLDAQGRSSLLAETEALCASVLMTAKELVVESLGVSDEERSRLMSSAKALGGTVAKLVRLYQEEPNESAAEALAFDLRQRLKEAVLQLMSILPAFTGQPQEALDLSGGGSGIKPKLPLNVDAQRRPTLPASPKKAPYSPLKGELQPPRATQEYSYADLWRDGDRKRSPPGCDIAALETYLSDSEFVQVLKMTRAQFYVLPSWRQRQLKVAVKLW